MNSILIVENDVSVSDLLVLILSDNGYACHVAYDALSGLEAFNRFCPDLVILDLTLKDMSGLDVCSRIRISGKEKSPLILCLTGKRSSMNRIIGLSTGADVCMNKPFDPDELVAQVRAMLRRPDRSMNQDVSFSTPHFDFDLTHRKIYLRKTPNYVQEVTQVFSPAEYSLLVFLARNMGLSKNREQILQAVWEDAAEDVTPRSVDCLISRLRKRLKAIFPEHTERLIHTVNGIGYVFRDNLPKNFIFQDFGEQSSFSLNRLS
jgi:DNA-binding response OmpR family regulator